MELKNARQVLPKTLNYKDEHDYDDRQKNKGVDGQQNINRN